MVFVEVNPVTVPFNSVTSLDMPAAPVLSLVIQSAISFNVSKFSGALATTFATSFAAILRIDKDVSSPCIVPIASVTAFNCAVTVLAVVIPVPRRLLNSVSAASSLSTSPSV